MLNLKAFFVLLVCTGVPFSARAQEVTETPEEARLHEIYEQYYSQPTDQETWKQLTSSLKSEVYQIQSGDNLWGISKIFFGDGNYWPKVWSVNSRIENPHLIEPGNEIRFRMGTSESEPSFLITERNTLPYFESASAEGATREYRPKPLLTKLPPSFPQWQGVDPKTSDFDRWGVEIMPRPQLRLTDKSYLQSFVIEGPFSPSGEVVESQLDNLLMSQGTVVHVKLKADSSVAEGQSYLIVADSGAITKTNANANPAHVLRVSGQLTLLSPLDEVTDPERGFLYYRAMINKSLDLALRGQKLIPGKLKMIDFSKPGRMSEMQAKVIGGSLDNNGFQFGAGNLVYLNKGTVDGLSEGDIFMIQHQKKHLFLEPEPLIKYAHVQTGQVQVVDARDHYATAVVLGSVTPIHPGDRTF